MDNRDTYGQGNVYSSIASSSTGAAPSEQRDMFQKLAGANPAANTVPVETSFEEILSARTKSQYQSLCSYILTLCRPSQNLHQDGA